MGQGTHKAEPWSPCVYRDAVTRELKHMSEPDRVIWDLSSCLC